MSLINEGPISPQSEYQNLGGASDSYGFHFQNQGQLEAVVYQASPGEVQQEKNPRPSRGSSLTSPVSQMLSSVASGSMFEGMLGDICRYAVE